VDVSPVRVSLSDRRRSEILLVRNNGPVKARFQVSYHAWQQTVDGKMKLSDTEDLVVYPTLLEIEPGKERRIKVSAVVAAGAVERSYRVFVEELPSGLPRPGEVRVVMRFGIPVFLQPPSPSPRPSMALRLERGRVLVTVTNLGSSYFVAKSVRVVGRAHDGSVVLSHLLPGWYVLAQGLRRYDVPLTWASCTALASLSGRVEAEGGAAAEAERRVEAKDCGP
jgi:fimbrial chaperone protein